MTMVLRAKPLSDVVRGIIKRDNGCWLDASDLSTMYQDAAGTIPVTAMEQPVGLWKDKSGKGNHATQSITASRPVVSARKNLLLATDALSTQSVTTVAESYVLSFWGSGSITLSGSKSAVLQGTDENTRVYMTITPSAGTLTLTVSGQVLKAQLEFG